MRMQWAVLLQEADKMKKKRFLPLCIVAVLGISAAEPAMPVWAAVGPGQAEEALPDGVTEEQWVRLNDQTIDFDELPDLVRYFNPAMQNVTVTIDDAVDNVRYIHQKMRINIRDLKDDADTLKESDEINTVEGMTQYVVLNMTVDAMKKAADSLNRTLMVMERPDSSVNANITTAAKNYTYYANQIMVGYNSALASRDLLQKVLDLSTAAYNAQNLSYQVGLATEADVLSANKDVLSAQAGLMSLDNTIENLKKSLYLMTGYSTDSSAVIGTVPELDMGALSSLDLQEGTAKAVGNNYNLITARHTDSNQTSTGIQNKVVRLTEQEQTIMVTMQSYYQAIQQAKSAYDASCTAYERASLEKGKADRSYQLGMLGKVNYLQAQMVFLQAESGKQSAYNTLYQAWDTYRWGTEGIIMDSQASAQ